MLSSTAAWYHCKYQLEWSRIRKSAKLPRMIKRLGQRAQPKIEPRCFSLSVSWLKLFIITRRVTFLYHCHDSLKETQDFKVFLSLLFHLPSQSFTLAGFEVLCWVLQSCVYQAVFLWASACVFFPPVDLYWEHILPPSGEANNVKIPIQRQTWKQ